MSDLLQRVIRRDRALMALGLAATTALAWVYLVRAAADMNAMTREMKMHAAMGMTMTHVWGLTDGVGLFVMWAVMMAGMMLPSAAPVILLVLGTYRRRGDTRARLAAVCFVAGYVVAWTAFSLIASGLQLAFHQTAVMAMDMRLTSPVLSALVLIAAGVYQWLPIKNLCLTHCQSPLGFISRYWREGAFGGFSLGVRHGAFCVGCCWLLMTLLFVVGVMNLAWVIAIAAFVFLEKLVPAGKLVGRLAGIALIALGIGALIV